MATRKKPATKRVYNRHPKVQVDEVATQEAQEAAAAVNEDQSPEKSREELLKDAEALINKLDPKRHVAQQLTKARLFDLRDLGIVERVSFLAMLSDLGYVDHSFRKLTDNVHNFDNSAAGVELNHVNKMARFVDHRTVQTQPSSKIGASVQAEFGFTEEIAPIPDQISVGGETYVRVIKEEVNTEAPWSDNKTPVRPAR